MKEPEEVEPLASRIVSTRSAPQVADALIRVTFVVFLLHYLRCLCNTSSMKVRDIVKLIEADGCAWCRRREAIASSSTR